MSCRAQGIDWDRIGDSSTAAESERRLVIEHIRACPECRVRAVKLDPTLVFATLTGPATGADEVAAMRARVAAARKQVDEGRSGSTVWQRARKLPRLGAQRPAAALVAGIAFLAVVTSIGVDRPTSSSPPALVESAQVASASRDEPSARTVSERIDAVVRQHLARQPLVEGAQDVRLSVEGDDFDVVLLVDAELELGGP